jgi:hypothetical protein
MNLSPENLRPSYSVLTGELSTVVNNFYRSIYRNPGTFLLAINSLADESASDTTPSPTETDSPASESSTDTKLSPAETDSPASESSTDTKLSPTEVVSKINNFMAERHDLNIRYDDTTEKILAEDTAHHTKINKLQGSNPENIEVYRNAVRYSRLAHFIQRVVDWEESQKNLHQVA